MRITLQKKMIIYYIIVVLVAITLIAAVFSRLMSVYIKKQTLDAMQNQCIEIEEYLSDEIENIIERRELLQTIKNIIKVKIIPNQYQLKNQFEIIIKTQKEGYVFASVLLAENRERLESEIIPDIKDILDSKEENHVYFTLQDTKYISYIYPVKNTVDTALPMWIIIYTRNNDMRNLQKGIFSSMLIALPFIFLICIIFAVIFSKSISKRIIGLRNVTKQIAKRNFKDKADIKSNDEITELASSINNMSDSLKAYHNAQQRFLQNVSHELKTPLASIQGYAEGIKDNVFDVNDEALDIITDECKRLKRLVGEISYLSKLETFDEQYSFEYIKIGDLVKNCIKKLAGAALRSNKKIIAENFSDSMIWCDRDKMERALINIIDNCIRHAEQKVVVCIKEETENSCIYIYDDGKGFTDGEEKHVFERFYKGKTGKTGLGLSITSIIIKMHNGTVTASNKEGAGAMFKITIPLG